jgi:hypothetical protein
MLNEPTTNGTETKTVTSQVHFGVVKMFKDDRGYGFLKCGGTRTVPNVAGNFPTSTDPALGDARVRESGRYALISGYQVQGADIRLYEAGAPR